MERGLFADGILIGIELNDGNLDVASAVSRDMRLRLAQHPPNYLQAHAAAVFGAISAIVAVRVGDLELATSDLRSSYPLAVTTADMPIMAAVGVSVGWLALAFGRPADAATVLGAAAKLRGTEDRTDPVIAELASNLRAALGDEFDEIFGGGMALDRPAPSPGWIRSCSPRPRPRRQPQSRHHNESGPIDCCLHRTWSKPGYREQCGDRDAVIVSKRRATQCVLRDEAQRQPTVGFA